MSIPPTKNGMNAMTCVSAMQKCIRRGMEREAMEFCAELVKTSKAFCTMACNRLEIISHEDIGLANPDAVVFTALAVDMAKRQWKADDPRALLPLFNAIRMLCRGNKSRECDHAVIAIDQQEKLNGHTPDVPDWAYDMHTAKGKQLGRGVEHFWRVGCQLVPAPTTKSPYEDEVRGRGVRAVSRGQRRGNTQQARPTADAVRQGERELRVSLFSSPEWWGE